MRRLGIPGHGFQGERGHYHCTCGIEFDGKHRSARYAHQAHVDRLFLLELVGREDVVFA